MSRTFTDSPAVRTAVPLLVGLSGPSGSGKTNSGLEIATGIQQVTGGDIGGIDTEARRMLHFADYYKFRHLPFTAPFGPLDYLAAIQHFVDRGCKIILVDSASHEHEGPGGVLDMHDQEVERLSGGDPNKAMRVTFQAWAKPKAERRKLLNAMLQMNCNFIFCFRAADKLRPVKGKEPEHLGLQPVAAKEWVYEMTCSLLLPIGARGVPQFRSELPAEHSLIKIPGYFDGFIREGQPLNKQTGIRMAEWARGTVPEHPLVAQYRACISTATLDTLEAERKALWQAASAADKRSLKQAAEEAHERLTAAPQTPAEESAPVT